MRIQSWIDGSCLAESLAPSQRFELEKVRKSRFCFKTFGCAQWSLLGIASRATLGDIQVLLQTIETTGHQALSTLQDWLLFLSAFAPANLGAAALFSECDATLNLICSEDVGVVSDSILSHTSDSDSATLCTKRGYVLETSFPTLSFSLGGDARTLSGFDGWPTQHS